MPELLPWLKSLCGLTKQDASKMKTGQNGIAMLKHFEGCKLTAYKDIVGVLTIGYGHTGPDVFEGKIITQEQADDLLRQDLSTRESGVGASVKVLLNQNQFDALVDFVYNLGVHSLQVSTLLRRLNSGDYGVGTEFLKWDKAGGQQVKGLTLRRQAEKELFERPC